MVSSFKVFSFLSKPYKHWVFIIDDATTAFLRYSHSTLMQQHDRDWKRLDCKKTYENNKDTSKNVIM